MTRTKTTDKVLVLLLAVAAGLTGAVAATLSRRRHHRNHTAHLEQKADIKCWENEGGNLRPVPAN